MHHVWFSVIAKVEVEDNASTFPHWVLETGVPLDSSSFSLHWFPIRRKYNIPRVEEVSHYIYRYVSLDLASPVLSKDCFLGPQLLKQNISPVHTVTTASCLNILIFSDAFDHVPKIVPVFMVQGTLLCTNSLFGAETIIQMTECTYLHDRVKFSPCCYMYKTYLLCTKPGLVPEH